MFCLFFVTVADIDECANKQDNILQLANALTPKARVRTIIILDMWEMAS